MMICLIEVLEVNKLKIKEITVEGIIIILFVIVIKIFDICCYTIKVNSINQKSILYYKHSNSNNSNIIATFMRYISDEDYDKAFDMLNKNNKEEFFNNDIQKFIEKTRIFRNSYINLEYSTIFSNEQLTYIDEEIMCMICSENKEIKHSIRFNVRTYKEAKTASIIILNVN